MAIFPRGITGPFNTGDQATLDWLVDEVARAMATAAANANDIKNMGAFIDMGTFLSSNDREKLDAAVLGMSSIKKMYELGAVSTDTGLNSDSTTRIRTINAYNVTKGTTVTIDDAAAQFITIRYNLDGSFKAYRTWSTSYTHQDNEIARYVIRKSSSNPTILESEVSDLGAKLSVSVVPVIPLELNSIFTTDIPDSSNFNSYTTPGNYGVTSSSSAATMSNCPSASAGRLIVMHNQQTNRYYQFYLENSQSGAIYYRTNLGSWNAWHKLASDADLLKLTSQRDLSALKSNTTAFISNIGASEDAPAILSGVNRYAWIITADNGGGNMFQYILPTADSPAFVRYSNSAGVWSDWQCAEGDGVTPVYVAFGASTTVGAVHHFAGEATTYSNYKYPEYVGKALNLKTINLGQGTTGFLARNGANNNFMDQIVSHDAELTDAKLISIVFGYGNDGAAGSDAVGGLPVGEFDDYYPYDEDGYHPSGYDDTTIDGMINAGCTLFGCLNWCIKYLQEHYPSAQLVLVFAAPSANAERVPTIAANSETAAKGVAPKKITFVDPYVSTSEDKYNKAIYDISQELPKLQEALNIPIINTFTDKGIPFSYYATTAKDSDGMYAIFSTTGDEEDETSWTWNSHPNDTGYEAYARYIAGLIISQFKH